MKFIDTQITFAEIPDEITLCINISNCQIHCKGCHSPHLWNDIGEELTEKVLNTLLSANRGITCICFMGGDEKSINSIASYVRDNYTLKIGWYSGKNNLSDDIELKNFDFIKLGNYNKELGPLNSKTTNQRFYKVINNNLEDITYKFWK